MKEQNVFVDALSKDLTINAVHVNVAQEYIMITEDKTYRCLNEWKSKIERRESWVAPVSLLASLILAFVTADFRDAFNIPKDTWRALFLMGAILSACWSVKSIYALVRFGGTTLSIDELISDLKKGAVIQKTTVDSVQAEVAMLEPKKSS